MILYDTIRPEPIVKTVRVVDSIPIIVEKPIYINSVDTLIKIDTFYLPREQKFYKGEEYEAWVSGYRPELDSLRVFQKTTEITITPNLPPTKKKQIGRAHV